MEYLEGIGQLKSLVISNNKIETIPDDIITLLNLERLDLSFNKLTLYVCLLYFYYFNLIIFTHYIICLLSQRIEFTMCNAEFEASHHRW